MDKLKREFYNRDTLLVAKELLGKYFVHEHNEGKLIGKIVEVEAYNGPQDKACHSYGNKMTNRNKIMFGKPGLLYVYTIYGMYQCMNVVTEEEGRPCAVLIRGIEPVGGINTFSQNRYGVSFEELNNNKRQNLSNGPGKLCIAMNIGKKYNGEDLCGSRLYITEGKPVSSKDIMASPRINIDYAEEYVDKPWRFFVKDNKYVSKR